MKYELRCEQIHGDEIGWTDGYRWWPELSRIFVPVLGLTMTIEVKYKDVEGLNIERGER